MKKSEKFKKQRNPYPVVDAVIEKNGKIALITKARGAYRDLLGLPGGFIEWDETAEEAAVREAREETGLHVKLIEILGVYSDPRRDIRGHLMTTVFIAKAIGGRLKAGDDAAKACWYDMKKIPWKMFEKNSDHPKIIRDYIKWKKSKRKKTFWSTK